MIAKTKAKELYNKLYTISDHPNSVAVRKERAQDRVKLFCLEIIEERLNFRKQANVCNNKRIKFWHDVIKEAESL